MSRSVNPPYALRRPPIGGSGSAAGSAQPSRTGTPAQARQTVSLEEWEKLCPLSDEQLKSIAVVKEKFAERPYPAKFRNEQNAEAGPSSRPSTPALGSKPSTRVQQLTNSPGGRSRTAGTRSPRPDGSTAQLGSSTLLAPMDPLHPTLVSTPQEFLDHFSALTLSTEHEQDSLYREHLAEVVGLREKCDELIALLQDGQTEVAEMLKCLGYVEEKSESLRGACEDLLEEQNHLLDHTSQLAHRLTFFTFLESAQKLLNSPNPSLVLNDEFLPMVKRLEECLGYLGEHRDFKDAELYLIRYQQCMTRSMTLIKIHFVNSVRALGQEVGKRLSDRSLSDTAAQALLYNKFQSLSASLRPLLAELETRAVAKPDELASLLAECRTAWLSTRQSLLGARVSEEVSRLEPTRSDLVDLTRAGCTYLKNTCMDEFLLFKDFFLSGEAALYGFLESLCDYLYDHLRPRILHEPSLETLCAVCTILQALMVQDVDQIANDDDDQTVLGSPVSTPGGLQSWNADPQGDYFSTSSPAGQSPTRSMFASHMRSRHASSAGMGRQPSWTSPPPLAAPGMHHRSSSNSILTKSKRERDEERERHRRRKPLQRLHTEVLLKMVLQDAQTRLVFRAQAVISSDVQYYAPKDADLDYPAKLPKEQAGSGVVPKGDRSAIALDEEDEDEPAILSLPKPELQASWFPTLRTTLWVLACLYSFIDSSVFDDLAQEAVITCRQSLSAASDILAAKAPFGDKDQRAPRDRSAGSIAPSDNLVNGRLFLVRHLLILKEMTAGLHLGRRSSRRDWRGITDFLRSLLDNASLMLGYTRGSIVRSVEQGVDARTDVDRELKRACEDLISHCAKTATAPLRTLLDQCTAYLASHGGAAAPTGTTGTDGAASRPETELASQPFATPDKVRAAHDQFKSDAARALEAWKAELMLYLNDEDTVKVLIPPAQNAIVEQYRQFHDLVRAEYDFSTAAALMTPSAVSSLLKGSISQ